MIFKETFKVRLEDIEKGNYLTNKGLLKYLENIGADHSSQAGLGILDIKETRLSWILLDWKVKMINRPKYGQILNVNTWARYSKRAYTYRDFEIYDENNQKIAIATSRWALINVDIGRPSKLDKIITEKFYPEEEKSVFEIQELDKIKEPSEFTKSFLYKVNRADIDINKHMHNLYYLDLAYETLPEEIYENKKFDNIRITYKKEIKLGDTVECKYINQDDKHIVTIFSEDGSIVHSIIELF